MPEEKVLLGPSTLIRKAFGLNQFRGLQLIEVVSDLAIYHAEFLRERRLTWIGDPILAGILGETRIAELRALANVAPA